MGKQFENDYYDMMMKDTRPTTELDEETEIETPELRFAKREIRNKRLNIAMKPSLLDRLNQYCSDKGLSKNDLLNVLINSYLKKEGY